MNQEYYTKCKKIISNIQLNQSNSLTRKILHYQKKKNSQRKNVPLKGSSPFSMSLGTQKYAQKLQALAVRKQNTGIPISSATSIVKLDNPSATMQVIFLLTVAIPSAFFSRSNTSSSVRRGLAMRPKDLRRSTTFSPE